MCVQPVSPWLCSPTHLGSDVASNKADAGGTDRQHLCSRVVGNVRGCSTAAPHTRTRTRTHTQTHKRTPVSLVSVSIAVQSR